MIPYGRQDINDSDVSAVIDVLKSDWLTQGPLVPQFEDVVAEHVGAEYAVAVNSGTSALHVACLALGLGPGDWLWTSPNTFVASANCGLYCGAQVDFVDIDPQTYNMSIQALTEKLEEAEKTGKLPKVVIPVHFSGQSCDMEAIAKLSKQYGFKIIEDASHAIGGKYKQTSIGSCTYSDITVFSFHPVKIITTAEGGMALTNNPELAERMTLSRSHGVTRDQSKFDCESPGFWYYEQQTLGFNYRMTDIQAALGLNQLQRLDNYVVRRHVLAERYDAKLKGLPLKLPFLSSENHSAHHLYVVCLQDDMQRAERKEIMQGLRAGGIGVNVHYMPVHLQPYYRNLGFKKGMYPEAELYAESTITLPLYPGLEMSEQDEIVEVFSKVLEVCNEAY